MVNPTSRRPVLADIATPPLSMLIILFRERESICRGIGKGELDHKMAKLDLWAIFIESKVSDAPLIILVL
ncbi:hypothetical protein [uncultured Vibrio sp.]|uniref:hypothetical protein n=1 Tax=uncultured Vibrio sp. TaxID=114054 RepID=UPI00261D3524|nr:hypothetical protein [uncultured Vibrio sp.]